MTTNMCCMCVIIVTSLIEHNIFSRVSFIYFYICYRMANQVNTLHFYIIYVLYLGEGVILCCSLYQMVVTDLLSFRFLKLLLYFSSMLVTQFIYCWFGNEIKHKVKWEPFTNKNNLYLIF